MVFMHFLMEYFSIEAVLVLVPQPGNIGSFSAVCWMFGRRLQEHFACGAGRVGGGAAKRSDIHEHSVR